MSEFGNSVESGIGNHDEKNVLRGIYEPESYGAYFEELRRALALAPDYRRMYKAFNRSYIKLLDQNTAFVRLNIVGPFAKTEYLLKEKKAPPSVVRAINDTRVRLRKSEEAPDGELEQWYLHDFMNLCRFVSVVYGNVAVPPELQSLFPAKAAKTHERQLIGDCVRVIVDRWDDKFIYADIGTGDEATVSYASGHPYNFDWSYLKPLIHKGAQLNLVRPRHDGGIIYPELVIFEPDYLVDISSIAGCFESYAESPLVHLLHKLQPAANSEAIVLGNFASQLLDETIQDDGGHIYAESVKTFFRNNALGLLTAGISPGFHEDAKAQKRNIAYAMKVQLPQAITTFDASNGLVEPSFFSEMLGLQGRMDYIQLDQGLIIEQKSGKGEFPYDNFINPRYRESHYVQMLLYMLIFRYNYREQFERNRGRVSLFLMYSKYKHSLVELGFAPELMFRALKIRNEMAWMEIRCASGGDGFRLLDSITADKMNMKGVRGKLWDDYQKPQIERLLSPLREADPLAKAYYFRFLAFVAHEHLLSKIGNKTKENSGFASKWHASLDEKLQSGDIYHRLTLIDPSAGSEGRVESVTLRFSETEDNDMANFREGDIVILYPYTEGKEPDARGSMVFRCTVGDVSADSIRLDLRASQAGARVFLRDKDRPWAIEHDFFESSYSPLYRGMHAFLSAPAHRRDLLLLQRRPETDPSAVLRGDYGSFNELSLRVRQAKDFFLIIGPPGTGKTSFGMLNTVREELLEPGSNVLVVSYTNRAVDEICSKLIEAGIDFIRLGSKAGCADDYKPFLLSSRTDGCANVNDVRKLIDSTRVMVGTTTAFNGNPSIFALKRFSLAVIDEASQILEPHLIGMLSAGSGGRPAISRFVMIGDHKQLPAVVQQDATVSRVADPALNAIRLSDCRLSLFERLLKEYSADPSVCYMLTKQGRMHPDIAGFANHTFYGDRLDIVPRPHQEASLPPSSDDGNGIARMLATRRIAFVATDTPDDNVSDKVNPVEAEMIAATAFEIYKRERSDFLADRTVGIIVPYRNQIAAIRNRIGRYGIAELRDITIDTVERYQGSQRRYIIYGFTVKKYHQLRFLTDSTFEDIDGTIVDRKLNVAMTRAEEHLIMFGNAELLANSLVFSKLLDFVRRRGGYFRVALGDYIAGRFDVPRRSTGSDRQD